MRSVSNKLKHSLNVDWPRDTIKIIVIKETCFIPLMYLVKVLFLQTNAEELQKTPLGIKQYLFMSIMVYFVLLWFHIFFSVPYFFTYIMHIFNFNFFSLFFTGKPGPELHTIRAASDSMLMVFCCIVA